MIGLKRLRELARPFARAQGGGTMVEFAVVFPVLVLLLVGAADFGRVFYHSIAVANAARAAAEWGAQSSANAFGPEANIRDFGAQDGAEAGTIAFDSETECRCAAAVVNCATTPNCVNYGPPRVFVKVTATKTVALILPYPGVPNNFPISRTATFRAQ